MLVGDIDDGKRNRAVFSEFSDVPGSEIDGLDGRQKEEQRGGTHEASLIPP